MFIAVMLCGEVERHLCVFRSGGKVGDRLFVTGRLGGAERGRHLTFEPRVEEGRWLARHFHVHAMMDLSDGLGADLPRLARASGCGFRLDQGKLPLNAACTVKQGVSDGEDYELLFALAPRETERLHVLWPRKFPGVEVTEIGQLTEEEGQAEGTKGARGTKKKAPLDGYDHFA
jgi:thiamine-monophosphate kinase